MKKLVIGLAMASVGLTVFAQQGNPFLGRWDFNMPGGNRASWIGVSEKDGKLEVWYQPTGGNVFEVKNFKITGSHLSLAISSTMSWELDAAGDKLTGFQKRGDSSKTPLTGVRSPELKRSAPKAWSNPEPLFNGKDLTGWEPIGDTAHSHWTVQDGLLMNTAHGANLKTTGKFEDFKVHYEVNCPDGGNSGFYLRGRYEVQIEYEPLSENPPERRIGSVYGRIAPQPELPRAPGQWETFDVTLVGRIVTEVHNGITVIDHKEIEGITGGAIDANEGEPGPFYIQGDHTGGLKFRNVTVSVPK
ncbi:MAG TPA: DUF1080 domain-containing protein [Bryobacteraceae bacterium]|nr:DUF1080 domain-containing protein [Bryobacteraceae bacterium]